MRAGGAWVVVCVIVASASVVACAAGDDGSVDLHGPDAHASDTEATDTTQPPIDSGHPVDSSVSDTGSPIDSSTDTHVADSAVVDSTVDSATTDSGHDTGVDTSSDAPIDAPPVDAGAEPVAGEVVISEILIDAPTVGTTSEVGEYVELYNASSRDVDLAGCVLRSKAGTSTETTPAFGSVPVAAGSFVVLQKSTTGMTFDYTPAATYTGVTFANSSADYVALQCAGGDVDGIGWNTDTDFPVVTSAPPTNVANERSTASLGAGKDTASTTWCDATTSHTITGSGGTSGTFKGTPGAANVCP